MPTTTRLTLPLLLTLTALTAISGSTPVSAQAPDPTPGSYMQSQPAPIQRAPAAQNNTPDPATQPAAPAQNPTQAAPAVKTSQPAAGVYVRMSPQGSITTVANTADRIELRVDSGIANISVHQPEENTLILVDLGTGQLDLIKDGMYTFNAETKTARVLVGEADAFPNTDANSSTKPIKVKEDHSVTFGTNELRPTEFQLMDARADVLPRPNTDGGYAGRSDYPAYGYGDGFYGGGFYGGGYPYYGWGYSGWDDPFYGFGYPYGLGLGLGWYGGGYYGGGFYGGGFRGRDGDGDGGRGFGGRGGGFGGRGGGGGFGGHGGFGGGGHGGFGGGGHGGGGGGGHH